MLRRQLIWLGLGAGLVGARALATEAAQGDLVYLGTQSSGAGQGVYVARFDPRTGQLSTPVLAADIERAFWVAPHPSLPVLYAASSIGGDGRSDGFIYAYAIDPSDGKLKQINRVSAGGGGPTHLTFDRERKVLFVANFNGGQVSVLPLHADGAVGTTTSVVSDYGTGPKPRQAGPHAHGVALDPSGAFVLTPDLGADRVFVNRYDAATRTLSRNDPPFEQTAPGTGPRHLVFHPNGRFAYLNLELAGGVQVFGWDATAGRLRPVQTLVLDPPAFTGARSAAAIGLSADGRFLYVSNRGDDTVVVLSVDPQSGRVTEVQRVACGGKSPWAFALHPSGEWLIVGNQGTDNAAVFNVDKSTGRITLAGSPVAVPKPVCVASFRQP